MKVCIYDATSRHPLNLCWLVGAWLFKLFGYFDAVKGVHTWIDAFYWLVEEDIKYDEIQFWGHGNWGDAFIGKDELSIEAIESNELLDTHIQLLSEQLKPQSLFWLRTCTTFGNVQGKNFAQFFANMLGCRAAGYTYKIAFPFHSGLHSIEPGEIPHWADDEGVLPGGKKSRWSRLGAPNNICTLRMSFPEDF